MPQDTSSAVLGRIKFGVARSDGHLFVHLIIAALTG